MAEKDAMKRRVAMAPPLPEVPAAEALPVEEEVSPVEEVITSVDMLKEEHPEDEAAIDEIVIALRALADKWGGVEVALPVEEAPGRLPVL